MSFRVEESYRPSLNDYNWFIMCDDDDEDDES